MKKVRNFMLVALVALTVASLYSVAGTYAKYTTSGSRGTDTARVAKFGVEVNTNGVNPIFSTQREVGEKLVVKTKVDSENVVAPGMRGTLAGFLVTGSPEVATRVSFKVNTFNLTNWDIQNGESSEFYMPLVFTVGGETISMKECDNDSTTFINKVKSAVEKLSFDVFTDENINTKFNENDFKIEWEWKFEDNTADPYQTNMKDTKLGNISGDNVPKIDFEVIVSVDQIENATPTVA